MLALASYLPSIVSSCETLLSYSIPGGVYGTSVAVAYWHYRFGVRRGLHVFGVAYLGRLQPVYDAGSQCEIDCVEKISNVASNQFDYMVHQK